MKKSVSKPVLAFLMIISSLCAAPSENEILSVLEEYLVLNNPNVLDDLLPKERRERVEEFNTGYRKLSDDLGKEEVFYFIRLSRVENVTPFVHDSAVLRVPIEYLEHYEEYDDKEKRQIGEFIWEHKQAGNLRLRHLRRVENPSVVKYLEDQYEVEGGPRTGRGYEIKKMLDEIYTRDHSEDSAARKLEQKPVAVVAPEPNQSEVIAKPEESQQVLEEGQRHRVTSKESSWWLWIAGVLVLFLGLGFVLVRKKSSTDS